MTQNDKAVRVRQEVERMEAERWTDAEWAAEQVALARRHADAARAEARELWLLLTTAGDANAKLTAERDKLRADLDHLHVGTIDHERMAGLRAEHAQLRTDLEHAQAALSSTRAALEAAQAAVHTPSPGGSDPATRNRALPVVPASCGVCAHVRCPPYGEPLYGYSCGRTWQRVDRYDAVPPACPIRSELAKAGGA